MKKRTVFGGLAGAAVVCVLAWLGGFDFNVRGFNTMMVGMMALCGAGIGALFSNYPDD